MDQNYLQPKQHHTLRATFGFILTMFMTILLIANGFLTALRISVLKGDDIRSALKDSGFYDTVRETMISELANEELGLSKEALATIIPDDIMSETMDKLTDSIVNDKPFDISYIEDDCIDAAQTTSQALTDEIFDEIDKHPTFDIKTLSSNSLITDFEDNFGVEISAPLEDVMVSTFGTTTVDVSAIGTSEVKQQVSDTVSDIVYNVIEDAFDEYTDFVNEIANDAIKEANDEYKLKDVISSLDDSLRIFHTGIIIIYAIIAFIFIIQLLMYLKKPSGAFKNLSVCTFIASAAMFISCGFLGFITDLMAKEFNSFDSTEVIIKDFIENNVSAVRSGIITVGIVCAVVGVVSVVIAVVVNNLSKNKRGDGNYNTY